MYRPTEEGRYARKRVVMLAASATTASDMRRYFVRRIFAARGIDAARPMKKPRMLASSQPLASSRGLPIFSDPLWRLCACVELNIYFKSRLYSLRKM